MIRIAICDNSKKSREATSGMLREYFAETNDASAQVHYFKEGATLLHALLAGDAFDLFILETLFPDRNGIELAQDIRKLDADAPIIFLSTSKKYALSAYSVHALRYILKPLKRDDLFPALQEVVSLYKRRNPQDRARGDFLVLPTSGGNIKVWFSEIIHVSIAGRRLLLCCTDGKESLSTDIRTAFEVSMAPLLKDDRFVRPRKSYIINMDQVERTTNSKFIMTNGTEIDIPRYKCARVKDQYLDYLNRHVKNAHVLLTSDRRHDSSQRNAARMHSL